MENGMKFLAIWGSPRRGGNSEILLQAFIDGATQAGGEVELLALREHKISPCLEIYHCFKNGTCPIKDDMLPLYDKLLEADVVVLATPIFFYSVSAQAKAFIDRTQALWARRYVIKQDFPGPERQGVLLATAATHGKLLFGPVLRGLPQRLQQRRQCLPIGRGTLRGWAWWLWPRPRLRGQLPQRGSPWRDLSQSFSV